MDRLMSKWFLHKNTLEKLRDPDFICQLQHQHNEWRKEYERLVPLTINTTYLDPICKYIHYGCSYFSDEFWLTFKGRKVSTAKEIVEEVLKVFHDYLVQTYNIDSEVVQHTEESTVYVKNGYVNG